MSAADCASEQAGRAGANGVKTGFPRPAWRFYVTSEGGEGISAFIVDAKADASERIDIIARTDGEVKFRDAGGAIRRSRAGLQAGDGTWTYSPTVAGGARLSRRAMARRCRQEPQDVRRHPGPCKWTQAKLAGWATDRSVRAAHLPGAWQGPAEKG